MGRLTIAVWVGLVMAFSAVSADHPWNGKNVAVLGDSISDAKLKMWKHWWKHLEEKTGIRPLVYAQNGWTWEGAVRQIDMMATNGIKPDAVLVFLGTNDFNGDVALGNWWRVVTEGVNRDGKTVRSRKRVMEFDQTTFCGRINTALRRLKHDFPDAQIVLMTPIHRGYFYCGPDNIQPDEAYANQLGLWLDDYVKCIREAGSIWSVPVIDLYAEGGLYPSDPSFGRFFNRKDTDLLHPNSEGHRRLATVIAARLNSIAVGF